MISSKVYQKLVTITQGSLTASGYKAVRNLAFTRLQAVLETQPSALSNDSKPVAYSGQWGVSNLQTYLA